jgi:hypothetical protein
MKKIFIFLLAFIVLGNLYGQDNPPIYQLNIKYNKKSNSKKIVPKSDSIKIIFLYSYSGDIVRFKTEEYEFISDTLTADNLYGIGGHLKIPKRFLGKSLKIYFNDRYVGSLKVNTHYSSAHLEYNSETRIFTWRYHKYRFIFI